MKKQPKTKCGELNASPDRPKCINKGCNNLVTNDGIRYRPVCGHCYNAGRGAAEYKDGVKSYRTGVCSNVDGHLNFPCPLNWKIMKKHFSKHIHTHLDHKDGNHTNNIPKNVEELCTICHELKGRINGDKSPGRYSYRNQ